MVKRGGSRGRGKGRGKGNASADSGAQAAGSSTMNKSESKQEKALKKNLTDDQARKMKDNEESILDTPAGTASKVKVAEGKKKADIGGHKFTSDNKAVNEIIGNAATKKELGEKKQEDASSEAPSDDLKMKSLVGGDSVELNKISSKPSYSADKAFLACGSHLTANIGECFPLSKLLQVTKQRIIDEQIRNLDPIASKVLQVLSLEDETKVTERKSEIDVSMPTLKCSKEIDERELSLDLNTSKAKQEISSENEKKVTEAKFYEDDFMPMLQCSQDIDERKLNLHRKNSKVQQQFSSGNEIKIAELKTDGEQSTPILQCSKDTDEEKLNFDLKTLKVQQERTETKFEVDESTSLLQDSKLVDITERIQNFDQDSSNIKQVISSETQNNLNELETEKHDEIINLRRDVNLRFEFDTLGNNKVLVDDKDQYAADKKQKIIFNIGDGNVRLSFNDKKVCIFTQGGEIDCSIRKNQVVFSLKESTTLSESSPEDLGANELSHSKDIEFVKDLGSTNITGPTEKDSLSPSEDIQHESGSKNVHMSTTKIDSSLVPSSVSQQRLQKATDKFLASVISSCDEFESEFLKCLNQRNEVTHKK